eukprot:4496926-Heterocapsa_arctica.AAC.1
MVPPEGGSVDDHALVAQRVPWDHPAVLSELVLEQEEKRCLNFRLREEPGDELEDAHEFAEKAVRGVRARGLLTRRGACEEHD